MKLMLERDSSSGKKKGGRAGKIKATWKGEPMNNFKGKTPVEIIEEKLRRLRTNEIDAQKRLRLREEEGGRAGKTQATWKGK